MNFIWDWGWFGFLWSLPYQKVNIVKELTREMLTSSGESLTVFQSDGGIKFMRKTERVPLRKLACGYETESAFLTGRVSSSAPCGNALIGALGHCCWQMILCAPGRIIDAWKPEIYQVGPRHSGQLINPVPIPRGPYCDIPTKSNEREGKKKWEENKQEWSMSYWKRGIWCQAPWQQNKRALSPTISCW